MTHEIGSEDVYFGGPDKPARFLRDVLQRHVDAVPAGGRIDWCTYYFRDRALAESLVEAQARGVRVRLFLEGSPRQPHANRHVIDDLQARLGAGLHLHRAAPGFLSRLHGHLHAKVYIFSAPEPVAIIGSFNPSGEEPETDPRLVAEIGDQDRGHNLLVRLRDPALIAALQGLLDRLDGPRFLPLRLRPAQNAAVVSGPTTLYFYPRLRPGAAEAALCGLGPGDRVLGAISHLKSGAFCRALADAAAAGATVELIVHDTERRVPQKLVNALSGAGAVVRRYVHPDGLPMHAKLIVIERTGGAEALIGSYNFNPRSRRLNIELLVRARDAALIAALRARFAVIRAQACAGAGQSDLRSE